MAVARSPLDSPLLKTPYLDGLFQTISPTNSSSSSDLARAWAAFSLSVNHCFVSLSLVDEIHKFCKVEELPRQFIRSAENEQSEKQFCSTHSRLDGRYVVRFSFKTNLPIAIRSSRDKAKNQLKLLSCCLRFDLSLSSEYAESFTEIAEIDNKNTNVWVICVLSRFHLNLKNK